MRKLIIEPGGIYSPKELMEGLGIGRTLAYEMANNETIRPIRLGRSVKFRGEDVHRLPGSTSRGGTCREAMTAIIGDQANEQERLIRSIADNIQSDIDRIERESAAEFFMPCTASKFEEIIAAYRLHEPDKILRRDTLVLTQIEQTLTGREPNGIQAVLHGLATPMPDGMIVFRFISRPPDPAENVPLGVGVFPSAREWPEHEELNGLYLTLWRRSLGET